MPRMAPMPIAQAEPVARRAVADGNAISYEVTRGLLAEIERLRSLVDAAHGLICNAHQKRVDDVTTADGASAGWAEAARRWIDAYPFGALDESAN